MRVLIIEDESDIANSLKKNIETEFFAVDIAEDGEIGLKLAIENNHDIIILDNVLPKKDGIDVCRGIRSAGKKIPIIMLSAKSETDTKIELLNAGADDYITKPFSFTELLARMYALLRRPTEIEEDIMVIDNLILDNRKHKVKRADKEIYLTRKEFLLLEYLIKNKGNALSRGMILEHVWDMNADPFSNTIESHILSLRKKIDTKINKKLIHTIPNIGYKIDDTVE